MEGETPFERRQRAPGNFWYLAENTRFACRVLWEAIGRGHAASTSDFGHFDYSPDVALTQAFRREAGLALELVLKAVIAQRIENGTATFPTLKKPRHIMILCSCGARRGCRNSHGTIAEG